MKNVKIFGERNTATRALQQMLENNSSSKVVPTAIEAFGFDFLQPFYYLAGAISLRAPERRTDAIYAKFDQRHCWKHCATNFESVEPFENFLVLFTIRHPASWLLSFYNNPYHILDKKPDSLEKFLAFEWRTVARERLHCQTFTPLALYEEKLRSYNRFAEALRLAKVPYVFLRFEDLILNQKEAYLTIAKHLQDPADNFNPLIKSSKSTSKSLYWYQQYYGNELWKSDVSEVSEKLNSTISWTLFEEFNYQKIFD